MAVNTRCGINDVVSGVNHLLFKQNSPPVPEIVELGPWRCQTGLLGTGRILLIDQAHFQRSGAPKNTFSTLGILHSRQLNDDAISSLLLNHRFGNPQLINPVTQGSHILLQGEFTDLSNLLFAHFDVDNITTAFVQSGI